MLFFKVYVWLSFLHLYFLPWPNNIIARGFVPKDSMILNVHIEVLLVPALDLISSCFGNNFEVNHRVSVKLTDLTFTLGSLWNHLQESVGDFHWVLNTRWRTPPLWSCFSRARTAVNQCGLSDNCGLKGREGPCYTSHLKKSACSSNRHWGTQVI